MLLPEHPFSADMGNKRVLKVHFSHDATELRLGQVAKRRLNELLMGGEIVVKRGDPASGRVRDRYGRTLALISVDGRILIEEGLAREWSGRRELWCN